MPSQFKFSFLLTCAEQSSLQSSQDQCDQDKHSSVDIKFCSSCAGLRQGCNTCVPVLASASAFGVDLPGFFPFDHRHKGKSRAKVETSGLWRKEKVEPSPHDVTVTASFGWVRASTGVSFSTLRVMLEAVAESTKSLRSIVQILELRLQQLWQCLSCHLKLGLKVCAEAFQA